MKRISLLFLVFSSLSVAVGCGPAVDLEEEKVALLRIHLADIQAHRDNEVDALTETIRDEFIYVGAGKVTRQTRQQIRDFFTEFLGADFKHKEYKECTADQ